MIYQVITETKDGTRTRDIFRTYELRPRAKYKEVTKFYARLVTDEHMDAYYEVVRNDKYVRRHIGVVLFLYRGGDHKVLAPAAKAYLRKQGLTSKGELTEAGKKLGLLLVDLFDWWETHENS